MNEFHRWLFNRLADKKVAVVGMGVEGQSTLKHLKTAGIEIYRVGDQREAHIDVESEKCFWGDDWIKASDGADVVIRSPGIHPKRSEWDVFEPGVTLLGQIDLIVEYASKQVVGVTGTLGKGSTVSILSHILKMAKISHGLGGNFGVPAWDLTDENPEWYILELSSFQLSTLKNSPARAGLLQITSEHLDWHSDTLDYQNAKGNLVQHQSSSDFCFYLGDFAGTARLAQMSSGQKINLNQRNEWVQLIGDELHIREDKATLSPKDCLGLGNYQMQNRAMAAALALSLDVDYKQVVEGCKSWPGLPLRMELTGQKEDLLFINDSYATRPEATLGAIKSLNFPFSIVLGGSEKNADFGELAKELVENKYLKGIVLIGQTRERLALSLQDITVPMTFGDTAHEAFKAALDLLDFKEKRALLFSPACASFGMFENYKHRGEVFNKWVREQV